MYIKSIVSNMPEVKFALISDLLIDQLRYESLDGFEIYRMDPEKNDEWSYISKLIDIVLNEGEREKNKLDLLLNLDYDLLHLHGPVGYSNSGLGAPLFYNYYKKQSWLKSKKPKVMTFHGLGSIVFKNKFNFPFSNSYFNAWDKIEEKNVFDVDKIICVDKYIIEELRSRGIKKELHFVPNGINLNLFKPLNQKVARRLVEQRFGFSFEDNIYFLYPNRLSSEKGINDVLDLSKTNLKFKFIISGVGPFENLVKSLCSKDKRFIYFEQVNNDFMPILMNSCDYVVTPLKHPGATRTNIEAVSTNTPVITTNISDRFPVIDKQTGLIYDSSKGERLEVIISSVLKKEPKFSSKFFRVKNEFDLNNVSRKINKLYKECI
ncbi:MAG TPA: glycosyltransferase [archaeon]|nr:glycosyltransferase [archaeon]